MTDSTLITHGNPKSPVSEAFRALRTNVLFATPGAEVTSILLTSPGPEEGKTVISANLAVTMAQSGKRVLLVDADMRRAGLHSLFDVPNRKGLSNVLVGRLSPEEVLVETKVEGMSLIPTGPFPPNPSELLGSKRMQDLLEEFKGMSDLVIFDTPPIGAVTDASVLAPFLDGCILVLKCGAVSRDMAKKAKELLERVEARILGVVLNSVDMKQSYGHYYEYYADQEAGIR